MKIRNLAALAIAIGIAFPLSAEQLTPEQALARIRQSAAAPAQGKFLQVTPQPVYTAQSAETGLNQYYVFSNAFDGYMILSADDVAAPMLGYADSGHFDPNDIPANMKEWLDDYGRQIDWAARQTPTSEEGIVVKASKSDYPAVYPLLRSHWNQSAPYNYYCPEYNGEVTATGCIATAMAQIMYFHRYPEKGSGYIEYTTKTNSIAQAFNYDACPFDWDNMLTDYNGDSDPEVNRLAVALLMKACGVSVEMDYNTASNGGSGASSSSLPNAYANTFNYDKGVQLISRDYYSPSQWNEIIYEEIASRRPVQYRGQGSGGHSFVCDGYDGNGYFHFNWGWGGSSDGYFLLSALDPSSLGIGGGSGGGFSYMQMAVIGIQRPTAENRLPAPSIRSNVGFFADQSHYDRNGSLFVYPTEAKEVVSGKGFFNYSGYELTSTWALRFENTESGNVHYLASYHSTLPNSYGYSRFEVDLSGLEEEGTYKVTPVFQVEEDGIYTMYNMLIPASAAQYFIATVTADGIDISYPNTTIDFQFTTFTPLTPIIKGQSFTVKSTLENRGVSIFEDVYMSLLVENSGSYSIADITSARIAAADAETTIEFEFTGAFSSAEIGTYWLCFLRKNDSGNYNIISPLASINLEEGGVCDVTEIEYASTTMPKDRIVVKATVKATGGPYADKIRFYLFPNFKWESGQVYSEATFYSDTNVNLRDGETAVISATGAHHTGEVGKEYFVQARKSDGDWASHPRTYFILGDAVTAIDRVDADETHVSVGPNPATDRITVSGNAIRSVDVYSNAGQRMAGAKASDATEVSVDVSALPSGHYIVHITTANESVARHIVKR